MFVETPDVVVPGAVFIDLGDRMISSTPKILNMIEPNSIESQTIFNFMSWADSSANSMGFTLSPDEDFSSDENGTMITSWHYFLNGLIFQFVLKIPDAVVGGGRNFFLGDALSSHIFVGACEVDGAVHAIGEHGVVVSCWYLVDRLVDGHSDWDLLDALSSQGSLVVAAEREHWSLGCQNDCVQSSTGYFVDICLEEGIGDDLVPIFVVLILI